MDSCLLIAAAESCRVNREETIKLWTGLKMYSEDDMDFQRRVFHRSGLAIDGTYLPPALAPRGCAPKLFNRGTNRAMHPAGVFSR